MDYIIQKIIWGCSAAFPWNRFGVLSTRIPQLLDPSLQTQAVLWRLLHLIIINQFINLSAGAGGEHLLSSLARTGRFSSAMRQYPRIKQRWEQLKPHPLTWDKNFIYCCFLTPTLQQNTLWIFPIVWKQRLFFFLLFLSWICKLEAEMIFFPLEVLQFGRLPMDKLAPR